MTPPTIVLSDHARLRVQQRQVKVEDLSRIMTQSFHRIPQADGTLKVIGIVIGPQRRCWLVAVVRALAEGVWLVITTWPSGLRKEEARSPKKRLKQRRRGQEDLDEFQVP